MERRTGLAGQGVQNVNVPADGSSPGFGENIPPADRAGVSRAFVLIEKSG